MTIQAQQELRLMADSTLTAYEREALRALRDGKATLLSPKEHLRLCRRSLIRGTIDKPSLTVVGGEAAAEPDRQQKSPP